MRRRIFSPASLLSLLLCVATVVLWVLSYWVADMVRHVSYENNVSFESDLLLVRGRVVLTYEVSDSSGRWIFPLRGFQLIRNRASAFSAYKRWFELFYETSADRMFARMMFPMGLIALGTVFLPAKWAMSVGLARPKGTCSNCSYDLTGNTSGVCPECGTAVAAGKSN